ncbi:MAG TPA: hypothetical protein VGT03_02630, partial [Candidatus Acidoferrales bacterium]|nr:hypothetical protein [Candidatus Acidoferrales bacterium]
MISAMFRRFALIHFAVIFAAALPVLAQSSKSSKVPGSMQQDLTAFVETPAVPGYEGSLAKLIRERLAAFSPKSDNL